MRNELATKLAFLRASNAFDGVLEVIETHMSWVFLTPRHAFKLKKPVQLPFVDYRTIERRRQSCENELRLGRRLAADVYDAVVPLVATSRGLTIGGAGEGAGDIVDWLVVMRRLPRERMLPQMVARREATVAHADALGDLLSGFYRTASRTSWDAAEYRRRLREIVSLVGREIVERGASRVTLDRIVQNQLADIEREGTALDARIGGGHVVDAHGDLRPEHVCLETPPVVIDPLEFDDDLRTLDAASELAFFALECERLGASWFAKRVLARYAECSGDRVPAPVLALYRCQHALTRALIALRHIDDAEASEQPRWRAKSAEYLARASTAQIAERHEPVHT
jgi:aminoglycoside phosphotransferase family enzyme